MTVETLQVDDTSDSADAPEVEKESIDAYEARVATEGFQSLVEDLDDSPEVEAESAPEVAHEEVAAAPEKDDYTSKILAEATRLLAEVKDIRAPKAEAPVVKEDRSLADQYNLLLTDRAEMARVMESEDIGLDPTSRKDVALFRNMVTRELDKELRNKEIAERDSRIAALEAKINGWETAAALRQKAAKSNEAWSAGTAAFNLDADPELKQTLRAAVDSLVHDGLDPTDAVRSVIKPFEKILPKKGPTVSAKSEELIEKSRAAAIAAVVGKGANRATAFKRGTTDTKSLEDFESKFFGN